MSQYADNFLTKLDAHISRRISERLKRLSVTPVPSDAKFIGREEDGMVFRYRIGDYRALYKVKYAEKTVLIAKIDKRSRVYD